MHPPPPPTVVASAAAESALPLAALDGRRRPGYYACALAVASLRGQLPPFCLGLSAFIVAGHAAARTRDLPAERIAFADVITCDQLPVRRQCKQ